MRINGVYVSYDIYDKKQVEAVQNGAKSIVEAYEKICNTADLTSSEKENAKSEIYAFFADVFSDEKALEILGEDANLTECVCAVADFMKQSDEVKNKIMNAVSLTGNRQSRRTAVHKRK